MKLTHYIYISAALALLTSCGEDIEPVYTVGEADNAIVLQAGVADGMQKMQTRGGTRASGNPTYVAFQTGTKMALYVEGTWLGHTDANGDASEIKKPTTGEIKSENTSTDRDLDGEEDSNQETDTRGITLDPQLYWDDYGTADPENMSKLDNSSNETNPSNGRAKGLIIYGAAVDGVTSAPLVSDWGSISWNVGTPDNGIIDQNTTEYWKEKDLLTSNNISGDNTLKFDTRTTGNNNILYFTHEMTKITVILTAGAGFNSKFAENPSVLLENFYYTGNVNVKIKTSTPTTDNKTNILMKLSNGGSNSSSATFNALVFPGNVFNDTDKILTLTADGNNYEVTAAKLNEAITTTDKTLLHGYNYILNITVNKTSIDVEATIVNWVNVNAANEAPIINIDKSYGYKGTTAFTEQFNFLRSTDKEDGYIYDNPNEESAVVSYSTSKYTMTPQLYWINHSIHYFFRGIWPLIGAEGIPEANLVKTGSDGSKTINAIKVENGPYQEGKFPSDLRLGMPRAIHDPEHPEYDQCHHTDVDGNPFNIIDHGICATDTKENDPTDKGKIRLNFQYAMSQVIVKLQTTETANSVNFDENTQVDIIGGYSKGNIMLSDGLSSFVNVEKDGANGYRMHKKSSSNVEFHDAIVPQRLVDESYNPTLKFRITVNATDGISDSYETVLGISEIEVQEQVTGDEYGTPKKISAWEPGKIYTYTLTITKTGIKVIATITDWITVKGSTVVVM